MIKIGLTGEEKIIFVMRSHEVSNLLWDDIEVKNRPVSKMHLGSPIPPTLNLPPITTGKLRHLQDATNPLAI